MNIRHLPNGDLKMIASVNDQEEIQEMLSRPHYTMISQEAEFIVNFLGGDPMGNGTSYKQVFPEEVGALTSAPLISDGENIYGYMDYQVFNFLEELANGKSVIWQKG